MTRHLYSALLLLSTTLLITANLIAIPLALVSLTCFAGLLLLAIGLAGSYLHQAQHPRAFASVALIVDGRLGVSVLRRERQEVY